MRTKEEIDKLVEENIKLVGYVINKKFSIFIKIYPSIEDDMFQEGSIALFKAAKEYDESKGVKFSTFACKCIFFHLMRFKERNLKDYYSDDISLNVEVKEDDKPIMLQDVIYTEEIGYKDVESEYKDRFRRAVDITRNKVKRLDRVLGLRFKGKSQREIAKVMNTTQPTISRVLKELKNSYENQDEKLSKAS